MKVYGLGRSRDRKGNICDLHLNPFTMYIHTMVGGGWATMQVLVVLVDEEESDK